METLKRHQQFIDGARWATKRAVAFFHTQASAMNDQRAKDVLNTAGREFGVMNKKAFWLEDIGDDATATQWHCFHCDEVFTDDQKAREHFGDNECAQPGCVLHQLNATEGGILALYREAQRELMRFYQEDTESQRHLYALGADHHKAMQREEEKGYARGLRDARGKEYTGEEVLRFFYTNHRGENAWRHVTHPTIYWGKTEWHSTPQWLLSAFDIGKGERRDFALCNVHDVGEDDAEHH